VQTRETFSALRQQQETAPDLDPQHETLTIRHQQQPTTSSLHQQHEIPPSLNQQQAASTLASSSEAANSLYFAVKDDNDSIVGVNPFILGMKEILLAQHDKWNTATKVRYKKDKKTTYGQLVVGDSAIVCINAKTRQDSSFYMIKNGVIDRESSCNVCTRGRIPCARFEKHSPFQFVINPLPGSLRDGRTENELEYYILPSTYVLPTVHNDMLKLEDEAAVWVTRNDNKRSATATPTSGASRDPANDKGAAQQRKSKKPAWK